MPLVTPNKSEIFRSQLWGVLHDGRGRSGQAFQFLLVILILLSLAMLPLEFSIVKEDYLRVLFALEVITTSLFTVEYALRIYAAPNRLRYVFSGFGIIDLLSIAPFYLGLFDTQFLQSLRILRVIRIIRIGEVHSVGAENAPASMDDDGHGLLQQDEKVLYTVSHHPLYLLFGSIPALVSATFAIVIMTAFSMHPISVTIAVTLLVFSLIFLWRTWLNYSYDLIYITSDRLIFHDQHLFGRSINQLNYHAITNVKPSYTGIFSYIFRFGRLFVETAADEMGHFEFHMASHHEKAAHLIMSMSSERKRS